MVPCFSYFQPFLAFSANIPPILQRCMSSVVMCSLISFYHFILIMIVSDVLYIFMSYAEYVSTEFIVNGLLSMPRCLVFLAILCSLVLYGSLQIIYTSLTQFLDHYSFLNPLIYCCPSDATTKWSMLSYQIVCQCQESLMNGQNFMLNLPCCVKLQMVLNETVIQMQHWKPPGSLSGLKIFPFVSQYYHINPWFYFEWFYLNAEAFFVHSWHRSRYIILFPSWELCISDIRWPWAPFLKQVLLPISLLHDVLGEMMVVIAKHRMLLYEKCGKYGKMR